MKTKTYKFEIEIEIPETKGTFLEELKAEIADEKRQLDLTHKINKESQDIHQQVLCDFVNQIRDQVGEVIDSIDYRDKTFQNGYRAQKVSILFLNRRIVELIADPIRTNVKDTKYITYAGGCVIRVYSTSGEVDFEVKSVDSFLTYHKHIIKECLEIKMKQNTKN